MTASSDPGRTGTEENAPCLSHATVLATTSTLGGLETFARIVVILDYITI